VDVPLLLMSAEHDRWSPPAQHEAMLEIAPHGELTIIPDAGHMVPVEAPGPVAAAIGRWIEAQWPVAGKAPGLSARAR
jgi:pimeloyl-ACP methyl ester carboxylesterase